MRNREIIFLMIMVLMLSIFTACQKDSDPASSWKTQIEDGDSDSTDTSNAGSHEDESDYTWADSDVISIILNGNSITVESEGITVDGSKITITSVGTYSFNGDLNDGQIIVNTEDAEIVRLILNGVNIKCSDNAPINIAGAEKTLIVLADNTENYLTDGSLYVFENADDEESNAALYSKSDLTIYGDGSLTVYCNYNDGITSKDGLKSDNDEGASKGYISIEYGDVSITSGGDAITAETDVIIDDAIHS